MCENWWNDIKAKTKVSVDVWAVSVPFCSTIPFTVAELKTSPSSPGNVASGGAGDESDEKYEKGIPKHGDIMFHNFLVTIQENSGQIIR